MRNHAETALLLHDLAYPGLTFQLYWQWFPDTQDCQKGHLDARLRVTCEEGTCNVTGQPMSWNGRWWRLSQHMTDSEVVWTAFKAVLTALEHEAREKFTFKGVRIADSHVDVHKLADFMAQPSVQDSRA